jgi:hypothetical protein
MMTGSTVGVTSSSRGRTRRGDESSCGCRSDFVAVALVAVALAFPRRLGFRRRHLCMIRRSDFIAISDFVAVSDFGAVSDFVAVTLVRYRHSDFEWPSLYGRPLFALLLFVILLVPFLIIICI